MRWQGGTQSPRARFTAAPVSHLGVTPQVGHGLSQAAVGLVSRSGCDPMVGHRLYQGSRLCEPPGAGLGAGCLLKPARVQPTGVTWISIWYAYCVRCIGLVFATSLASRNLSIGQIAGALCLEYWRPAASIRLHKAFRLQTVEANEYVNHAAVSQNDLITD